jgi:gluconolactonase
VISKRRIRLKFIGAFAILSLSVLVAMANRFVKASSAIVPTIERLDPTLDTIIPTQGRLEKVASGFTWTEGPVWIQSGYLMFADIPSNSIRKWTPGGEVSIFMQPSGYRGSAPYGGPEPGSNGMTLDRVGRLTVAGHAQQNVWRLERINSKAPITIPWIPSALGMVLSSFAAANRAQS